MSERVDVADRIVLLVDEIHAIRNLPVVLAERLGFLKGDGLDVIVMNLRYDVSHSELLADGRVDAVMAYYHHNVVNHSLARPSRAVITLGVTPGMRVLVAEHARSAIESLGDLKGRRVITGGANSAKSTTANWLALKGGFALSDYTRLPTYGKRTNSAMLRSGEADAIVVPAPDAGYYESGGIAGRFADLVSPGSTRDVLGTLFPSSTVFMAAARIDSRPDFAQHLANAFVRTLGYLHTHSLRDICALVPDAIVGADCDRATYRNSVASVAGMFGIEGLMPPDGAEEECRVLGELNPNYRAVSTHETYTNDFVLRALAEAQPAVR